jgi:broad specificity phosphatase PhoE
MAKGTLVILRHGQTDYNAQKLMTGQRDIPLNAVGEAQADAAGALITTFVFDKAYSSTLGRAFNTAAKALKASGTNDHLKKPDGSFDIEQRREIIELDTGDFTGRNHKTDPEIVAFERRYDRPLPGGESQKEVVERVQRFFDEELQPRLARGETVLVVSHAGIMRAFDEVLGLAAPDDASRARIPNATPTVVEYEDGVKARHYQVVNPVELASPIPANGNKKPAAPKFGT